jgi:hypothetical protein
VYESYANDCILEAKNILSTAPPGVKTINIEQIKLEKSKAK